MIVYEGEKHDKVMLTFTVNHESKEDDGREQSNHKYETFAHHTISVELETGSHDLTGSLAESPVAGRTCGVVRPLLHSGHLAKRARVIHDEIHCSWNL